MQHTSKKYRINQLLDQLPLSKNRKAKAILPDLLSISPATFDNYRAIAIDEHKDIPHHIVVKLEKFFGIQPGELSNCAIDMKSINQYVDTEGTEALAAKFGLSK